MGGGSGRWRGTTLQSQLKENPPFALAIPARIQTVGHVPPALSRAKMERSTLGKRPIYRPHHPEGLALIQLYLLTNEAV
jgi:hypothetical protein